MARTKKQDSGERLTHFMGFKTTPTQGEKTARAAAKAGLSVSDYIRARVEKNTQKIAAARERDPKAIRALMVELQRQGTNLNQLARVANTTRSIESAADIKELKARLKLVWEKVLTL